MLKSSILVIPVSLVILCIVKENAAVGTKHEEEPQSSNPPPTEEHEPFIVLTNLFAWGLSKLKPMPPADVYQLPTEFIKHGEKLALASGPEHTSNLLLCPQLITENEVAETTVKSLYEVFPATEKCLFVRDFTNHGRGVICEKEPQLSLDKREENGSPVTCGINANQQLVDAQYYNCGTEGNMIAYFNYATKDLDPENAEDAKAFQFPPFTPVHHLIYEICYDFRKKRTLWTRHSPMTPALLTHPESPYKNSPNEFKIEDFKDDTSSLDLDNSTFKGVKNSYSDTDSSTMAPFTMVPMDHMALLYWKKATTHIINAAPLSPKFVLLMKAINNGILQASSKLFVKTQQTLQIYTYAETNLSLTKILFLSVSSRVFKSSARSNAKKHDLFEPNIWYKFIYNRSEESGVLIVLHNTNGELPLKKECDSDKRLLCDFKNWSNSPEPIPYDIQIHAYCCKTTEERVKKLFSMNELVLKKEFDIQEMINDKPIEPIKEPLSGE